MTHFVRSEDTKPYGGARRSLDLDLINRAIQNISEFYHNDNEVLENPNISKKYAALLTAGEPNELFGAMFLTTRNRLIASETLFRGTIDGASVHPRVVVQRCLAHNAAAVVFYHNHPSGDPSTSQSDIRITERLKSVLEALDIRVLDHLVVGGSSVLSMAEYGSI